MRTKAYDPEEFFHEEEERRIEKHLPRLDMFLASHSEHTPKKKRIMVDVKDDTCYNNDCSLFVACPFEWDKTECEGENDGE